MVSHPPDVGGAHYSHDHYPAMKIGRLAVDRRYRGTGLGRRLLELGLAISRNSVASAAGCRFVVLNSKNQSIEFYQKNGFKLVETESNLARSEPLMFLDLRVAPE